MYKNETCIDGINIKVYSLNTVVVGTGAAGFNAADTLYSLGRKDIAIVTEGINMGTSRNTGSDKQTYYKLSLAGEKRDSVYDMARTLFEGGSMHGDIALVEAALSVRCFYKLVSLGVPFPHNRYGEYVGYKTDHDPIGRATSAGPLTSKYMTERLEESVRKKGIDIFDGHLIIGILTDALGKNAIGLVSLNTKELYGPNMGITLFNCTNIIYATGGPAGMYLTSVYPQSQTGGTGMAFEAGAKGVNLTEWQYGIASIKFRWNVSGTYQQIIPRYVSTDQDGCDEREFLNDYFKTPGQMMDAIFLKGYQWPFDPRKALDFGSSLIDILVYNEIEQKGRRVFLDYTHNPLYSCGKLGDDNNKLDFDLLGPEAYKYLKNSDALFGTPFQRLYKMNKPAVELYKCNGIDLSKEYLEIAVCAQHNNGGLLGNIWWESNLKHFFPVGEVNGTFGVYRPGGSALNSTQVGSFRAAQYISNHYTNSPLDIDKFLSISIQNIKEKIHMANTLTSNLSPYSNVLSMRTKIGHRMTKFAAHIRSLKGCETAIHECLQDIKGFTDDSRLSSIEELPQAFRNWDILISQYVYLNAIMEYILKGGKSRGSYIINDKNGALPQADLPDIFRSQIDDGKMAKKVCEVRLNMNNEVPVCHMEWKDVRSIPEDNSWFENVWNDYMKGNVIF